MALLVLHAHVHVAGSTLPCCVALQGSQLKAPHTPSCTYPHVICPATPQDWWQEHQHPGSKVRVVLTPAQHWSSRAGFDRRATLWGGWAVLGPQLRFWFAGERGLFAGGSVAWGLGGGGVQLVHVFVCVFVMCQWQGPSPAGLRQGPRRFARTHSRLAQHTLASASLTLYHHALLTVHAAMHPASLCR